MKKILFILCLLFSLSTSDAQLYDFGQFPICWDSAGVKKIQLYSETYHSWSLDDARWRGYMNSKGERQLVPVSELSPGQCDDKTVIENTGRIDTIVQKTCMRLTRAITNTLNSEILYPEHILNKYTFWVGTQPVKEEWYVEETSQRVESIAFATSTTHCDDFDENEFVNLFSQGDYVSVLNGDTVVVNQPGTPVSHFTIGCDNTIDQVKVITEYIPIFISGVQTAPGGNGSLVLTSSHNTYTESWSHAKIATIRLIGIGADTGCTYKLIFETQKFD